jgi:glyoxylase-like metal-dependent hydrolase (beta-lactamase superfamily II)
MAEGVAVRRVVVGPLQTNAYLLCRGSDCIVVDPGADARRLLRELGGRRVLAVVATHLHFDHVGAAAEVVRATRAPFVMHALDWEMRGAFAEMARLWGFREPELPEPELVEGDAELPLGLRAVHTPGHSPGSVSIIGAGFVLAGDTLFYDGVGRTDLPGGDFAQLVRSVCRLYAELPEHFLVYPGHGKPTTLGREAGENAAVPRSLCGQLAEAGAGLMPGRARESGA